MSRYVGSFIIVREHGHAWLLEVNSSDAEMLYVLVAIDDKEKKPIIANRCEISFSKSKGFCNNGLCITFYVEGKEVYEIDAVTSIVKR